MFGPRPMELAYALLFLAGVLAMVLVISVLAYGLTRNGPPALPTTSQPRRSQMYRIIGSDNKEYGPVDLAQLRRWLAEGRINTTTKVLPEGATEWRTLGELPEFAAPSSSHGVPAATSRPASARVNGPATGLLVVAILGFVTQATSFFWNVFGMSFRGVGSDRMMNMFTGTLGIVFNFIAVVTGVIIVIGALKMKKLESHSWAMASSIIALLPCVSPCCLVGLPIGIWAVVVLSDPDVKNAFPQTNP